MVLRPSISNEEKPTDSVLDDKDAKQVVDSIERKWGIKLNLLIPDHCFPRRSDGVSEGKVWRARERKTPQEFSLDLLEQLLECSLIIPIHTVAKDLIVSNRSKRIKRKCSSSTKGIEETIAEDVSEVIKNYKPIPAPSVRVTRAFSLREQIAEAQTLSQPPPNRNGRSRKSGPKVPTVHEAAEPSEAEHNPGKENASIFCPRDDSHSQAEDESEERVSSSISSLDLAHERFGLDTVAGGLTHIYDRENIKTGATFPSKYMGRAEDDLSDDEKDPLGVVDSIEQHPQSKKRHESTYTSSTGSHRDSATPGPTEQRPSEHDQGQGHVNQDGSPDEARSTPSDGSSNHPATPRQTAQQPSAAGPELKLNEPASTMAVSQPQASQTYDTARRIETEFDVPFPLDGHMSERDHAEAVRLLAWRMKRAQLDVEKAEAKVAVVNAKKRLLSEEVLEIHFDGKKRKFDDESV